jgi:hypothetical protein
MKLLLIATVMVIAAARVSAQTATPSPTFTPSPTWTPIIWPTLTPIPATYLTPRPWATPTSPPPGQAYTAPGTPAFNDDGTNPNGFAAISDSNVAKLSVYLGVVVVSFWIWLTVNFERILLVFRLILFLVAIAWGYKEITRAFQEFND